MTGDSLRAQLVRGGLGSLGIKLVGTALAFAQGVLLARMLGPSGYGVYAFVISLITLLAIPAQVGLPQVVVRETAKAESSANWALMRGLWRWSNRFVTLFSTLMIGIGVLALAMGGDWLEGERWPTLAIGLILVPLGALASIRAAALRGLRQVILGQLPESLIRPGLMLLFVTLTIWLFSGEQFRASQAMQLQVVATFTAFIIGAGLLLRARPAAMRARPEPSYQTIYWRRAAVPLALLGGLQLINNQTDIIMLGVIRSDEEVGVYRVVVQIATLVVFGLQALNLMLQPYFAALHAKKDYERLQRLATNSARAILAIAILPVMAMVFAGDAFLTFFFGPEYRVGYLALGILALGQLVNAAMGSVGLLLNMTGYERDTMRGVAIAAVVNVALNLILIPRFGIEGAAASTAITLMTWNIILRSAVIARLGIESSAFGSRKFKAAG